MNHAFLLRKYGDLTIEEQDNMTYEDRQWWLERAKEEIEKQGKAQQQSVPGQRDHTPGQPPV